MCFKFSIFHYIVYEMKFFIFAVFHFPCNFGADKTRLFYIGLRGELLQNFRDRVYIWIWASLGCYHKKTSTKVDVSLFMYKQVCYTTTLLLYLYLYHYIVLWFKNHKYDCILYKLRWLVFTTKTHKNHG